MLTLQPLKPDGSGFGAKERAWNEHGLLDHWRAQWALSVNQALAAAESGERIDHRTLKAQGIPRAPLPYLPHPLITGRFRKFSGELSGRLNRWHSVRFRKLALDILHGLRGSDRTAWGVRAAWEEEAARGHPFGGGKHYVPER